MRKVYGVNHHFLNAKIGTVPIAGSVLEFKVSDLITEKTLTPIETKELVNGFKVLEVSTRSNTRIGRALSAFNLQYKGTKLECVYQSSKVYEKKLSGGETEVVQAEYEISPYKAKLRANSYKKLYGNHIGYLVTDVLCKGESKVPLNPPFYLYDVMYAQALFSNLITLLKTSDECMRVDKINAFFIKLNKYEGFTDMYQSKSVTGNCQARSLALVCALHKYRLLEGFIANPQRLLKFY